jgi:hypothetical protein
LFSLEIIFIYTGIYFLSVKLKKKKFEFSYLDDQLKQEIPLKQCRTLTNTQQENIKTIMVTNKDTIYLLDPLGIEEQIDQLLNSYRLQEAITLAESNCSSIKQRNTNPLVISTKKRIALIEFGAMNVVRALTLFDDIHIDYHEVSEKITFVFLFEKI